MTAKQRARERNKRNSKLYKTEGGHQKRFAATAKNSKLGRYAFAPSRGTMNGQRL